jgi:hypothetical protein
MVLVPKQVCLPKQARDCAIVLVYFGVGYAFFNSQYGWNLCALAPNTSALKQSRERPDRRKIFLTVFWPAQRARRRFC